MLDFNFFSIVRDDVLDDILILHEKNVFSKVNGFLRKIIISKIILTTYQVRLLRYYSLYHNTNNYC